MNNVPTLSSSAMLVDLTMKVWTAHKLDRKVTAEVNADKHAQSGAARVNKNLFKDVQQLEAIKRHVSATRLWVYENTLPWSDSGERLLPTEAFFDFKTEMNQREADFDALVEALLTSYTTLISAQAFKLGAMFDADEYPTTQQVADKFSFKSHFSPLPTAGDFRVDIGEEALMELRSQYNYEFNDRFSAAVDDIKERLLTGLRHLSERLEYDDGGKKKVFRDSAVENVSAMLQQVKVLNISNDEALEAARLDAVVALASTTPTELRKEDDQREETKRKLDEILAKFAI